MAKTNKSRQSKRNGHSNENGGDHHENSHIDNGYDPSSRRGKSGSKRTVITIILLVAVFFLGAVTGILYVGWVQHEYGFGKDTPMEQHLLPFGPSTANANTREEDRSSGQERPESKQKRKSIILNQDNPNPQKSLLPTLFGLNFNDILVQTDDHPKHRPPRRTKPDYDIDPEMYRLSYTRAVSLKPSEKQSILDVAARVHEQVPHLHQRTAQISWGGPHFAQHETNWWYPAGNNSVPEPQSDLSALDGGHLLYSYLFIMKFNPNPKFPFRLCGQEGCPPERAILHTLEWREKYKPWLVSPSVLKENAKGYVYHRGFSPEHFEDAGKHGTVWARVGHQVKNELAFFRGILNAADRAIAASLIESQGEVGKYNVIFDCSGFSVSNTPSFHSLKQAITMLQDHYPNRLGMIFLAHLSRPGEMFLRVILRLITKEVREKVKLLPNYDKEKSLAILRMVVEEDYIPEYLGGTDTYKFDVNDYYPQYLHCTEEEAQEFITTMPYHAN